MVRGAVSSVQSSERVSYVLLSQCGPRIRLMPRDAGTGASLGHWPNKSAVGPKDGKRIGHICSPAKHCAPVLRYGLASRRYYHMHRHTD